MTIQQLGVTMDLNHYHHTVDDVHDLDYSIAQKLIRRPSKVHSNEFNIEMHGTSNNSNLFKS